jgi:flagellar hook-basal body complex protein FliE
MNVSAISGLGVAGPVHKSPSPEIHASSFESMLIDFGQQTLSALRAGEATGIAALEGKASVQQAVMATLQAEQALQAAIAIRDKLVGAINEVTRMQI